MTFRTIACACLAVAITALPLSADDWPQFRGPNRDGHSAETGINKNWNDKQPREMWRANLSDNGFAGPSVANGKVFIIDHQGNEDVVRALNLETGKQQWEFRYAETARHNYGYARATPTVDEGNVYTASFSGQLHCLKEADGSVVWSRNIVKDFKGKLPTWMHAASPVVDGDKLIVPPGGPNAFLAALNKANGETIWQGGGSDGASYSTPAIATIGGRKQYVLGAAKSFLGIDAADGKVLWSYPWVTRYDVNAATPLVINDHVFFTSGYNHGCILVKIGPKGAEKVWENKEMQSHFNSPLLAGRYIYGTGDPGFLMCIDPQTGKTTWKEKGFEKGGIIAIDGTIIALDGARGDVVMVKLAPESYQELGRFKPLGGRSWTPPIVANGKLIIRNNKTIACYDLK